MIKARFEKPAACDVILFIVSHRPGITEGEVAEAIYGERDQPRVHQDCDLLEAKSLIKRDRQTRPLRLYLT
jgi:hypothetical protein